MAGRLLGAHQSGRARTPAALPGHHPPGSGADLRGAGGEARRRRSAGLRHRRQARRRADHELPVDLRQGEGQPAAAERLPAARRSHQHRRCARRQPRARRGGRAGGGRRRPGLRHSGGADTVTYRVPLAQLGGRAVGGARDALLSGDAALLSAGSLLHVAQRGHRAALLPRGPAQRRGDADQGLEAPGRHQRAGRGFHDDESARTRRRSARYAGRSGRGDGAHARRRRRPARSAGDHADGDPVPELGPQPGGGQARAAGRAAGHAGDDPRRRRDAAAGDLDVGARRQVRLSRRHAEARDF